MWSSPTADQMLVLSMRVFKPLELLANYTLLQYLIVFYWPRRLERRVQILFCIGSIGVICLIPFANEDQNLVTHLNDISEACCTVTFLLQITIVGRDLNQKIKFKSILYLTYAAEALVGINLLIGVVSAVATIKEGIVGPFLANLLPNIVEIITLVFIFCFRVYCIARATSWSDLLTTRRVELACYFLFATHEFPFAIMDALSGISWEAAQSLWNRVTIAMCLLATVQTKMRSSRSSVSRRVSGPSTSRLASLTGVATKRGSASAMVYVTTEVRAAPSPSTPKQLPQIP